MEGENIKEGAERNARDKKLFVESFRLDGKIKTKGKPARPHPIFHQFPRNSLEFLNGTTSKQHLHWKKYKEVEMISVGSVSRQINTRNTITNRLVFHYCPWNIECVDRQDKMIVIIVRDLLPNIGNISRWPVLDISSKQPNFLFG